MLVGQYIQKISTKGRTAVPAKFRQALGQNVIVAKWYEGCLVIVDSKSWQALLLKLTGKSEVITAPVRDTDRFILGSAFEINLDNQGRFVIPKLLREYAGLTEQAVFVGLGDRVEVWDKKGWGEREKYVQKYAGEMVEKLAKDRTRKGGD
jgi:MraZ protein